MSYSVINCNAVPVLLTFFSFTNPFIMSNVNTSQSFLSSSPKDIMFKHTHTFR